MPSAGCEQGPADRDTPGGEGVLEVRYRRRLVARQAYVQFVFGLIHQAVQSGVKTGIVAVLPGSAAWNGSGHPAGGRKRQGQIVIDVRVDACQDKLEAGDGGLVANSKQSGPRIRSLSEAAVVLEKTPPSRFSSTLA